jgi:hypothetical protein
MSAVSTTIFEQIGGGQMVAMTGARGFCTISNGQGLGFQIPGNLCKSGINLVTVVLDPSDTYTVTFNRRRGTKVKAVKTVDMVYCDQLRDLFEEVTGLLTSLSARR